MLIVLNKQGSIKYANGEMFQYKNKIKSNVSVKKNKMLQMV